MTIEEFNSIIDFAIEREKEAVQFYRDLQGMAKFKAQVDLLKDLEDMEKGHIVVLEDIRKKGPSDEKPKKVTNLKISDYLVEAPPTVNMTYQDIVITAMKREEASFKLYTDMASQYEGTELSNTFSRIAAEEAQHKLKFEKIYDDEFLKDN